MDRLDLTRISGEVERESELFANRTLLDSLTLPSQIMGRENKAKELLRFLLGYKQGLVVPFVSVFGRSGSGKSTVVKFVCENLGEEVSYAFVNLRKAKTVFGCANLILAELGEPNLKSPQGMNLAVEKISDAIELRLRNRNEKNKKNEIIIITKRRGRIRIRVVAIMTIVVVAVVSVKAEAARETKRRSFSFLS